MDGSIEIPKAVGSAAKNIYADNRSLDSVFPELKGINPHYIHDAGAGVNTNCVSCVNATQARLTGRDTKAVASPSVGYANKNSLLPSAPFGFGNATTPAQVITRNATSRQWNQPAVDYSAKRH